MLASCQLCSRQARLDSLSEKLQAAVNVIVCGVDRKSRYASWTPGHQLSIRVVVISVWVGGQKVGCSINRITSYQAGSSGVRSLGIRFRLHARSGSPI